MSGTLTIRTELAAGYAPDYEEVDVAQAQPQHGPEYVRRIMLYYLRAFPDLRVTLDDLTVFHPA